jgi:translation initiation factor IF-2
VIIGFNVRPEGKVGELAAREGVDVRYYSIIYQAIERSRLRSRACSRPSTKRSSSAPRDSGDLPCPADRQCRGLYRPIGHDHQEQQGSGGSRRRCRGGQPHVESLRRFKDDVTEVREGFECGIGLGTFNDIKVDDIIETFEMREKPRA